MIMKISIDSGAELSKNVEFSALRRAIPFMKQYDSGKITRVTSVTLNLPDCGGPSREFTENYSQVTWDIKE